jgi:hypothetical protein
MVFEVGETLVEETRGRRGDRLGLARPSRIRSLAGPAQVPDRG